jgi:hypothetical protein
MMSNLGAGIQLGEGDWDWEEERRPRNWGTGEARRLLGSARMVSLKLFEDGLGPVKLRTLSFGCLVRLIVAVKTA